jgi:type IV pilus assembly protein PilM
VTFRYPAQQIIDQRVSAVIAEVRTTLDFFLSSSPGTTRLSRVVLAGAGSRMTGLPQRLASELRVPVEQLDPFAGVTTRRRVVHDAAHEPQLAVAVGLCAGVLS